MSAEMQERLTRFNSSLEVIRLKILMGAGFADYWFAFINEHVMLVKVEPVNVRGFHVL